ncbi:hypothetical protein IIB79_05995 [candidate division KSB1 bacterium]|nr:hypothetical protein [candidate division KSB1 bacterium]
MKAKIYISLITTLIVVISVSLAFSQEKTAQDMVFIGVGDMKYTCPMKGDMVFSSEPGECPKCGMDMKEMTAEEMENMPGMTQKTGMINHEPGESLSIVGEVIETACFLRGELKGANHIQCAEMCSAAGIPLAILENITNKIYLPVPKMGKNPNEHLKAFIGQQVTITGIYMEKGGLRGIEILKVEKNKQ